MTPSSVNTAIGFPAAAHSRNSRALVLSVLSDSSRCERSFSVVSINAIVFPLVDLWSSIAAGVGFGASQSFMFYAPVVARALGPGALFSPHCSAFSTTILAAWNALLFNAMHVLLMIIAFDAYRTMSPPRISALIVLHAAAASFVSDMTCPPCTHSASGQARHQRHNRTRTMRAVGQQRRTIAAPSSDG